MRRLVQLTLFASYASVESNTLLASPEMLTDAVQLGAKDCGYCRASATGGEALNERGLWLQNELSERSETEFNVVLQLVSFTLQETPVIPTKSED